MSIERVPRSYIFCVWLWVISFGYILGIYPFPHIIPLIGALTFTFVYSFFTMTWDRILFINLWESMFLYFTYQTWKSRGNTLEDYRLLPDVIIFMIYLLYLYYNNETFYSIYFIKNYFFQKKFKGNILEYLTNRFYSPK